MKRLLVASLTLVAALAVLGAAAGQPPDHAKGPPDHAKGKAKGKPSRSATPVFKVHMKPSQEVPRIQGLRADAVGHVTFDLTRDSTGAITAGEVVFYVNYSFPGSVTITGLHVHVGAKGTNGDVVINSGVASIPDADGVGNVTTVVPSVAPETLQAILDNPRGYYVNLHTSVHDDGAVRAQLRNPVKR